MDRQASGRVVVGLSGTLAGYQALRYAVGQARARNVELIAVRTYRGSSSGLDAMWRDVMHADLRAEANRIFGEAMGGLPSDVIVKYAIREGLPGQVLIELAESPSDLVVIGGSGRRWRGGRIAKYCARHAVCPVVILPQPEMARVGSTHRLRRSATADVEKFLNSAPG